MKELRLAKARTCKEANTVLEKLLADHNRRFAKPPRQPNDAHRRLGPDHRLESILSIQHPRVVSNDYVVRWANRFYQLLPPVYPGERGGRVVIEERLDGSMAIRLGTRYLKYEELKQECSSGGSAPVPSEFTAKAAGARAKGQRGDSDESPRRLGTPPAGKRSGRTPAEPYPLASAAGNSSKPPGRPAQNHPWRKSFKPLK